MKGNKFSMFPFCKVNGGCVMAKNKIEKELTKNKGNANNKKKKSKKRKSYDSRKITNKKIYTEDFLETSHIIIKDDPDKKCGYSIECVGAPVEVKSKEPKEEVVETLKNELTEEEITKLEDLKSKIKNSDKKEEVSEDEKEGSKVIEVNFVMVDEPKEDNNSNKEEEPKVENRYRKFDKNSKYNKEVIVDVSVNINKEKKSEPKEEPKTENRYRKFDKNSKFNKEDIFGECRSEKKAESKTENTNQTSDKTTNNNTKENNMNNEKKESNNTNQYTQHRQTTTNTTSSKPKQTSTKSNSSKVKDSFKYASIRGKSEVDYAFSEAGRIASNIFRGIRTRTFW